MDRKSIVPATSPTAARRGRSSFSFGGLEFRAVAFVVLAFGASAHGAVAGAQGASTPPAAGSAAIATPAVVTQGRVDPRLDVNFTAMVNPQTVYVGQQATYQIGVFLSDEVRQRLRRNPEFMPSDVRSMLTYDLPTPARGMSRQEGGRRYEVHVFQRALFPLTPGSHVLGGARLTYALPLSNSFFSREENHTARTSAYTIVAREPPARGRPADYSGAVGRVSVDARMDATAARVGEPVVLTVTVSGVGNVSLFPRPSLSLAWGEAVTGAERVSIDSTSLLVQGRKEFEWVVTPKQQGDVEMPPLRYPYFNPYTEQYEVALSDPVALHVTPGALAVAQPPASDSARRLALRTVYRGPLREPPSRSPMFWFGLVMAPIPLFALGRSRRDRSATRPSRGDRLRAIAAEPHSVDARDVRRAFADAIAERSGVGATTMSDGRVFVRALRRVGVTSETARRAQLVLADLDRAVYGGEGGTPATELRARAVETFRAIDEEAIPVTPRGPGRRPTVVTALVLAASLGTSGLAMADGADGADGERQFARGVAMYESGKYADAAREFGDLARRTPRAADAWANLGTAAWEMSDTGTAAVGWQRALRLEPLAADVRERLDATPGFRSGILGDVPPVPAGLAESLGALAWVAGWLALAYAAHRQRRSWRRVALGSVGLSLAIALGTVALSETVSGRRHAIVVSPERLRVTPALASELAGAVMTGEAARTTGRQSVWTRVELADGRSGWLESRHLASLDIDRAP